MKFFAALFLAFIVSESHSQIELEVAFPNLSFSRPVDLQHVGDGSNRLFVVEQAGIIRVFENSASAAAAPVFLDIRDRVNDSGNEEGLLGLAFHPNYQTNGRFYVNYTAANPRRTVIARYFVSVNPNQADRNSEQILLEISQPFSNHNGGQLAFGPDGFLYIATGDGGSGGDPQGNGQSLRTLLGKILRIDVDNPSGGRNYGIPSDNPFANNTAGFREEIYAYGLRNPWRFSFDPATGRLWAGDVGQDRREEVDLIEKGQNYGWNIMEGSLCFQPSSNCNMTGLVKPIWEYDHSLVGGRASITGGYVYRGKNNPELVGAYLYADFESGHIWALRYDGVNPSTNTELQNTNLFISSFGIDQHHELYICAFDGRIYRFKPTASTVDEEKKLPASSQLAQNYPNPFWSGASSYAGYSSTFIKYRLTQNARVELSIYNLRGQIIRTLLKQEQAAGTYTIEWDSRDNQGIPQPSGTYFYRLRIGSDFVETRKLVLVR
ncbi:MAG: PQQ-dependent sugar dehydrogenase [candidate division KSB1 bacterium]|nr:PQQ-dependent sugar dehydrogenase [candidate division KSB1 bacterium]